MKKIITAILCLVLALSMFAGCGKTEAPAPTETPEVTAEPTPAPTEKPEETEAPAEPEETEEPEATPEPIPEPTAPPQTAAPVETPAPVVDGVDLKAFFEELGQKYEMAATMEVDSETMDYLFPGLNEIKTLQCVAYTPMISAVVSEYVFVQCENADDAEAVRVILQNRMDEQANGGAWYPASMEAWSKAVVLVKDNYVLLIANAEHAEDIKADFLAKF